MPEISKPQRVRNKYHDRILHRDGGVCLYGLRKQEQCAGGGQIHHIQKRSQLGNDVDENLITLCAKHHRMAERLIIRPGELRQILADYYGGKYAKDL